MSPSADHSVASILAASLITALPAFAMLLLIGIADLTLDGTVVIVIVVCAVVGMFAGDALLARTTFGAAQLGVHSEMVASLDAGERKVHNVARFAPIGVAVLVAVLTDTGTGGVALGLVVGYVASLLAFAVWLHGRRDEFSHARGS